MTEGNRVIITGAAGFVGQALAAALLKEPDITHLTLTDVVEPPRPQIRQGADNASNVEVRCIAADLTDTATISKIFEPNLTIVYLLHGIMSGQAEADLELGLKVNLDSTRAIFDHLRDTNAGVKVVFTGSTAVYGPPRSKEWRMSELDAPAPRTSYGAQKHVCETLLDDFSRRGLLDGRVVRLPTVSTFSMLGGHMCSDHVLPEGSLSLVPLLIVES